MSWWWCRSSPKIETDAVEVKVKSTLDATEVWIDMCKAKKLHNEKQRKANAFRREKLEEDRQKLLADRSRALEEVQRIQASLEQMKVLFARLEEAEKEIARIDEEIEREELEMRTKEQCIRERLNSIQNLTTASTDCEGSGGGRGKVAGLSNQTPIHYKTVPPQQSPRSATNRFFAPPVITPVTDLGVEDIFVGTPQTSPIRS